MRKEEISNSRNTNIIIEMVFSFVFLIGIVVLVTIYILICSIGLKYKAFSEILFGIIGIPLGYIITKILKVISNIWYKKEKIQPLYRDLKISFLTPIIIYIVYMLYLNISMKLNRSEFWDDHGLLGNILFMIGFFIGSMAIPIIRWNYFIINGSMGSDLEKRINLIK